MQTKVISSRPDTSPIILMPPAQICSRPWPTFSRTPISHYQLDVPSVQWAQQTISCLCLLSLPTCELRDWQCYSPCHPGLKPVILAFSFDFYLQEPPQSHQILPSEYLSYPFLPFHFHCPTLIQTDGLRPGQLWGGPSRASCCLSQPFQLMLPRTFLSHSKYRYLFVLRVPNSDLFPTILIT